MTGSTLDFTGRVAVITGAGRGIGRAHADLLAARGARVIVNDVGSRTAGGGADDTKARVAAAEIVASGGIAEPDTSDVSTPEGAAALIGHAVDSFGRLDIVLNNAGIFALDTFPDLDLEAMRRQFAVHIGGGFNVTRAAWPHLAAAGYGRVVFTTSTSALGAADTIAYGTAKAGVLGLGRSLAQAGIALGIKVNLVAPMAMTRMMGHRPTDHSPAAADRAPALVSPLVAVLCHESCPTTGETFMAGMRRISRLYIAESPGYLHPGLDLTPETVLDRWDRILDITGQELLPDTASWLARNDRHLAESPVE